eukprot:13242157-Alexandrium_andersonii.AAC.1
MVDTQDVPDLFADMRATRGEATSSAAALGDEAFEGADALMQPVTKTLGDMEMELHSFLHQ